jgi:hypothetical protein
VPASAPVEEGRTDRHVVQSRPVAIDAGAAGASAAAALTMHELVRTTDAVLISAIEALLNGARIKHMVVDQNMSVLEGSIGVFPRRILVGEDQLTMARRLLADAGLGHELRPDRR